MDGKVSGPLPLPFTSQLNQNGIQTLTGTNTTSSSSISIDSTNSSKTTTEDVNAIELSVIVPCFNETSRLHLLLGDALPVLNDIYPAITSESQFDSESKPASLKSQAPRWEILLVDDGSSDGTAEYAIEWAAKQKLPPGSLRVCKLQKNRGKGGAVAHGMKHFRGHYAIFADADGASRFDDVRRLLSAINGVNSSPPSPEIGVDDEKVIENEKSSSFQRPPWTRAVVAIGSRAHMVKTDAVVNRSFIRNFLMYGLHTLVYIFGIRSIRDTQCGFKMFTRPAATHIFPLMHTEGWIFDVEILIIAMRKRIPILEVPISWHEVEGSKVELARDSIQMAIDLVVMRLAYIIGIYTDTAKPKKD